MKITKFCDLDNPHTLAPSGYANDQWYWRYEEAAICTKVSVSDEFQMLQANVSTLLEATVQSPPVSPPPAHKTKNYRRFEHFSRCLRRCGLNLQLRTIWRIKNMKFHPCLCMKKWIRCFLQFLQNMYYCLYILTMQWTETNSLRTSWEVLWYSF